MEWNAKYNEQEASRGNKWNATCQQGHYFLKNLLDFHIFLLLLFKVFYVWNFILYSECELNSSIKQNKESLYQ